MAAEEPRIIFTTVSCLWVQIICAWAVPSPQTLPMTARAPALEGSGPGGEPGDLSQFRNRHAHAF
eukprot:11221756-Lingulodinium_polyedra.AAC.1